MSHHGHSPACKAQSAKQPAGDRQPAGGGAGISGRLASLCTEENGELPRGSPVTHPGTCLAPAGILVTTSMTGAEEGCKSGRGGTKKRKRREQWTDDTAEVDPVTGLMHPEAPEQSSRTEVHCRPHGTCASHVSPHPTSKTALEDALD